MRRGAGIGAVKARRQVIEQYQKVGQQIEQTQFEQLQQQLNVFQASLQAFASKYKHEINANPLFRHQFTEMCAKAGVDPLATQKSFWSGLGLGEFYYELSVQLLEICAQTRPMNGGIMSCDECCMRLNQRRKRRQISKLPLPLQMQHGIMKSNDHHRISKEGSNSEERITENDIKVAISKVKCLGNNIQIVTLDATKVQSNPSISPTKKQQFIFSVPNELNSDSIIVFQHVQNSSSNGKFSIEQVKTELGWNQLRIDLCIKDLVHRGLIWEDYQISPKEYWFYSIFVDHMMEKNAGLLEEIVAQNHEDCEQEVLAE
jgi:ESCRT-II complex subunit VPS22